MNKKNQSINDIDIKLEDCKQMSLKLDNYVVQSNELISGIQSLKLRASILIRLAIMQIKPTDTEFKPYIIKLTDFCRLLNISSSGMYRDVNAICNDIYKNPVEIKTINKKTNKIKYMGYPWVQACGYDEGYIYIQLNSVLKPYLLNLKDYYTQYQFDEFINNFGCVKSIYTIRIYELIISRLNYKNQNRIIPKRGITINLLYDDIRIACNCNNKFKNNGTLKEKVKKSLKEIENLTLYRFTDTPMKNKKEHIGISICVKMSYK